MRRSRVRISRFVLLALVVGVIVLASSVWAGRTDPSTVPQEEWYELATKSPAGDMRGLTKPHKVVIADVDESLLMMVASYMPPPIGTGARSEVQGTYDPKSGTIRITGKLARASAGLPSAGQALFRHALRHEYGHAFADDWRAARKVKEEPFLAYSASGEKSVPQGLPKEMAPVVKEFSNAPANLYGPTYLTQSFDEYLAESYARFLDGLPVPPDTEAFFEKMAK